MLSISHYSSKDAYGGSAMFTVWIPIACQGKSFTGNCGRASVARADHSFASRMFASATCDSLKLIPTPGRSLRQTATPGVTVNQAGGEKETTKISSRGHKLHLYQLQQKLPLKNQAFESLKRLSTLMR